jgi:hypothetical protein
MRKDTVTEQIQCSFKPEEMANTAKELAAAVAELEAIKEEKKETDSAFKARMDEQVTAINTAARKYNKGYEVRDVICDIRYNDPEAGQKSIYRMDTKELVRTVEMTWEEKQEELQLNLVPDPSAADVDSTLAGLSDATCTNVKNGLDCRAAGLALEECCAVCRKAMEEPNRPESQGDGEADGANA